jgi:hypothetical protein
MLPLESTARLCTPVELAGVAAIAPERADDRAGLAHQGADLAVGAVGVEQVGCLPSIQKSRSQPEPDARVGFS